MAAILAEQGLGRLCFFWAGTSLAIDVEAVVKFKAPTLKREQGFDVGRHVFAAQSHVETALALAAGAIVYSYPKQKFNKVALGVGVGMHLIQKVVFLPLLSDRAVRIINGEQVGKSYAHAVYLVVEAVKVGALLMV